MIGFDFKAFKFENCLYYDKILESLFFYNFLALRNKIVNDGLNCLTQFFNFAFSTYGISKSNNFIFIKINEPEKRLQLFLKPGFIVNIFDFLMSGRGFLDKNHANIDNQINDSFAFETMGLAMHFFKITSFLEILWLGNQINIYFNLIKMKS